MSDRGIIFHQIAPAKPAYRVMAPDYVDAFFSRGCLRLSSFAAFSNHNDDERKDAAEGLNATCGIGAKQTMYAVTRHGDRALVLCASQSGTAAIFDAFGHRAAILINDPVGFGAAIALRIPGCLYGIQGPCVYKDGLVESSIGDFEFNPRIHDMQAIASMALALPGRHAYFRKKTRYAHQREYRWVWLTADQPPQFLDIVVPEAIRFCRKVKRPRV